MKMASAQPLLQLSSCSGGLWSSVLRTLQPSVTLPGAARFVSTSGSQVSQEIGTSSTPDVEEVPSSASKQEESSSAAASTSMREQSPDNAVKDPTNSSWDRAIQDWSKTLVEYHAQGKQMLDDQANTSTLTQFEGDHGGLADSTSEAPINSTRVWLHMHETPDGLKPSFCRKTGDAHYMYDFQGFQDWRVERNALLSDESKCLMYKLHQQSPDVWDSPLLAKMFRIREQRVLAIIKLKSLEFEQAEQCVVALNKLQTIFKLKQKPSLEELQRPQFKYSVRHLTAWFDPWLQFYEAMPELIAPEDTEAPSPGSEEAGESASDSSAGSDDASVEAVAESREASASGRKVQLTASEKDEVVKLHNLLTEAANQEAKHIACDQDVWKCNYHFGTGERFHGDVKTYPSFEEMSIENAGTFSKGEYEHAMQEQEAALDKLEIDAFKLRMAWSLEEVGKSIQREPRKRGEKFNTLPKKPSGGWPILLSKLGAGGVRTPSHVANPDGSTRNLTEDEQLYLRHFKREPKLFSRPRRQEPFTNSTLHAFQRKPNKQHDIYNHKYKGNSKNKRPTNGADGRSQRMQKLRKNAASKKLAAQLKALNV